MRSNDIYLHGKSEIHIGRDNIVTIVDFKCAALDAIRNVSLSPVSIAKNLTFGFIYSPKSKHFGYAVTLNCDVDWEYLFLIGVNILVIQSP